MAFEKERQDFERDGFVIVRQLLSPGDFRDLNANLDRYIREVVPTLPDADAFYEDRKRPETLKQMQRMGQDPFFANYRKHPRWLELAQSLLGEPVEAHEPEWFNKPPGTEHTTPPHQDNYYFNFNPCSVVTIWMALDSVDNGNGCLRYVPGSHLKGVRPHHGTKILGFSQGISDYGPDDVAREAAIHLQPGDVAVHHGNTIHRAEANRSATRNRRAFAMVIKGASCRRDEASYARYKAAAKAQHQQMGLKVS